MYPEYGFESQYGSVSAAPKEVQPVNCAELMHVTSLEELAAYSKGTVVRLPDFAEGQPFVARIRRPSLLVMAKSGRIPNSLLATANGLFTGGGSGINAADPKMLSDVYDICHILCDAALVSPTLKEIEDAGLELSDDQLMAIFNYTQTGVKALESFR